MADSILRLKVESQEYDNKLKQATQGLTRYIDECRKVGGTLEEVEKETLDYVRALGQMETTSRTATGKLAEMKKTFTELAAQYKQMTDAEKQSPFGKALAASLDELKGRIGESKTQLDDINKSINGGGGLTGALDAVAGKFGLSIDQVTKFGGVVGAATTAVQVAKDAFFQSESGIDEWGRTVEGAKGAYSVFLDTLNNGNWSDFFQNLRAAIQGGRDLYDVFDRLGSIKSNNAAAIAITQKEIAELRLAKQQGENVDAKLKAATERLAALQKQSVSAGMAAGSQSAFQTIRNGVNSIGGAGVNDATIRYVVDRIIKGGQGEFDKYKRNYEILQQRGMVTRNQTINDSQGGTYERQYKVFDINALTEEQQKQYAIAKAVTEGETRIQKGIAAYAQAVSEGTAAAREEFKGNRYALQGSGGGSGSGKGGKTTNQKIQFADDSIMAQEKLVQDLTMKWKTASAAVKDDYKKQLDAAQTTLDTMMGKTSKAATQPQTVIGLSGFNEQTIAAWTSMIKSDLAKADFGSDMYNSLTRNLRDMSFLTTTVQDAIKLGLDIPQNEVQQMFEKVFDQGNLPSDMYAGMIQKFIDDFKNRTGKDLIVGKDGSLSEQEVKKEDDVKEFTESVGKLSGGLSQVTGGLKSVGIEIPKEIDQVIGVISGVGQVVSGVGTIVSLFSTTAMTANTTAVGLNTAAIASLIAALEFNTATNFIPFFSGGGLVGRAASGLLVGNNKSGDNLRMPVIGGSGGYIGINDGELILNRAQQSNLVGQLEGNGLQNLQLEAILYGEDIRLSLNRNGRRTGRGEYVQSRNIRLG